LKKGYLDRHSKPKQIQPGSGGKRKNEGKCGAQPVQGLEANILRQTNTEFSSIFVYYIASFNSKTNWV